MSEIAIEDLPLYNRDFDADYPPEAGAQRAIADVDARPLRDPRVQPVHPRRLKNAIDWASRPWGKNSFAHKPSAVIGASPGSIGTAVAQQNLRSILSFCNSPQMNAPEAYIQFSPACSPPTARSPTRTEQFLQNYMPVLRAFIERVLTVLPRSA